MWDPGFAHGLLIAVVSILHVFVSHFAVGGGLYLVITEARARRRGETEVLEWLQGHARFFILLTLVFGAITGVGIWFTIGLLNPAGTSALIHAFVWGWAIEWVFFFVEIAAAMVYYYGWDRLSARAHLAVGWIYFASAWLSMVVINGILSFQLTPGAWLETRGFWDGLLNPTYVPSLVARTFFAVALAGLFSLLLTDRLRDAAQRIRLVRYAGIWAAVGLAGAGLGGWWWWSVVPGAVRDLTAGALPVAAGAAGWVTLLTFTLAVMVLAGPVLVPRIMSRSAPFALLVVALALMGSGEWLRESIRKPWIIRDYLYVNGIAAADVETLRAQGVRATARWVTDRDADDPAERGEGLFRVACLNCHARQGYNGLATRVPGWDAVFAGGVVQRLEYLRAPMPPWVGTEEEAADLGEYLVALGRESSASALPAYTGAALFDTRCGICHEADGFRSMRALMEGWSAEEIDELLQDLETDEMPPFTGTDEERVLLAEWLARLGAGQVPPPRGTR